MEPTRVEQPALWVNDIVIQTTKELTTTGGTVWDAARRAAKYLEAMQQQIGLQQPGVKILELGAGCGLLGMLLARNLPQAGEVCVTEQAYGGALQHLQRNVAANAHLPNMTSLTTCSCDWTHFMDDQLLQQMWHNPCVLTKQQPAGDTAQQIEGQRPQQQDLTAAQHQSAAELADMRKLLCTPWDIIIGSDLVYNTAGVKGLPRVLAALMQPQQTCFVASSSTGSRCCCCSCPTQPATSSGRSCCCQDTSQAPAEDLRSTWHRDARSSSTSNISSKCSHCQSYDKMPPGHGPVVYYAHTKHRFDAFDVDLFAEMEKLGLTVSEVIEDGEDLPPPSPPPFSSLYPEMRIAMFKFSMKGSC